VYDEAVAVPERAEIEGSRPDIFDGIGVAVSPGAFAGPELQRTLGAEQGAIRPAYYVAS
jgi:hypothetical protein